MEKHEIEQYLKKNVNSHYFLGKRIGKGGFAEVYELYGVKIDNRDIKAVVKVNDIEKKMLNPEFSIYDQQTRDEYQNVFIKRGLEEIEALRKMANSNYCTKMLDYSINMGKERKPQQIFIIQKYYKSLDKYIEEKKVLSEKEVLSIARNILSGLREVHKQDILHRDIKPDNIFCEMLDNGEHRFLLGDFGVAKERNDQLGNLFSSSIRFGNRRYVSPEYEQGKFLVKKNSDLFSVGIVLIELVNRKPVPYDVTEVGLNRIIERLKISSEFQNVLKRSIVFDPFKRCQTAEGMLNDVEQIFIDNVISQSLYVWYVAYGSNLLYDRFKEYILDCTDKSAPLRFKTVVIPYSIYFAYKSNQWNNKGVAFLDVTQSGSSLGRMYLITAKQFVEIQKKEGKIYNKRLYLGEEAGIPMITFTSDVKRSDIESPDIKYINTILEGLKETYTHKTELALNVYLYGSGILNENDKSVLRFIRNSNHGVSLQSISEEVASLGVVQNVVKKLLSYQFIKQDGRNIAKGINPLSSKAVVYTRKTKRDLIDILL